MASIPLGSAQIRLGRDFNQQFYYGDSNTAQLRMNDEMMRDYSIGGSTYGTSYTGITSDSVPFTSGAQRSLSMYRGGCGRYPDLLTTSSSTADNSQAYALESSGGQQVGIATSKPPTLTCTDQVPRHCAAVIS